MWFYRVDRVFQGCGTDESTLCRIMVSRSENDMLEIRKCFKELKDHSLHSAIDVRTHFHICLF